MERRPVKRSTEGKECRGCGKFKPYTEFYVDASRFDGYNYFCRPCASAKARRSYTPKPRPQPGRRFKPARDGDFLQARRRVDHLKAVGLLPDPNSLPCADCGHVCVAGKPGKRHEYDHYLGYAPEHHETVQAVCSACHHTREENRRNQQ